MKDSGRRSPPPVVKGGGGGEGGVEPLKVIPGGGGLARASPRDGSSRYRAAAGAAVRETRSGRVKLLVESLQGEESNIKFESHMDEDAMPSAFNAGTATINAFHCAIMEVEEGVGEELIGDEMDTSQQQEELTDGLRPPLLSSVEVPVNGRRDAVKCTKVCDSSCKMLGSDGVLAPELCAEFFPLPSMCLSHHNQQLGAAAREVHHGNGSCNNEGCTTGVCPVAETGDFVLNLGCSSAVDGLIEACPGSSLPIQPSPLMLSPVEQQTHGQDEGRIQPILEGDSSSKCLNP